MYYTDKNGDLYTGDMQPGDREATAEEVRARFGDPLENAKKAACAALKEKRLAVEYAGPLVEVGGVLVRFPSEVKDETRLNSLAGLFMADPTARIDDWKVADGVYVTMTAPLLQTVKAAGFIHISATYSVERAKRVELETLETPETVTTWLPENLATGWPE